MLARIEDLILRFTPTRLVCLALRFGLGIPFFKSGLTKWEGLKFSESATTLFQEEFKLHIFGKAYDFPYPEYAATAAGIAEILLPILLFVGFGTRIAATGLLVMTVVIQLVFPDGWANFHLPWAAMALALMIFGGGKWSADWLLRRAL